jgi:hypothetical protein
MCKTAILMAVLLGGIPLTARAIELPEPGSRDVRTLRIQGDDNDFIQKAIQVRMKGHFLFRADRLDILRPDARLIVNGKTFVVNLNQNRDLWHVAAALDGHTAIVTGTLDGDRIDATSLKGDEDFIHKTVNVEVKGRLYWNKVPLRCLSPEFGLTSGKKHFALDFATEELHKQAIKLDGQDVIAIGTLTENTFQGDLITVTSVKAAGGHYVDQSVSVALRARLHLVIKDAISGKVLFCCDKLPEPFCKCWTVSYGVTINDQLYLLDLDANKALLGQAAMYVGNRVIVTGTLQGNRVVVSSLERAMRIPDFNPEVVVWFAK